MKTKILVAIAAVAILTGAGIFVSRIIEPDRNVQRDFLMTDSIDVLRLSPQAKSELRRLRITTVGELREFNLAYNDILSLRDLPPAVVREINAKVEELRNRPND